MNTVSKSVMTVALIFGAAFLLASVGCQSASNEPKQPAQQNAPDESGLEIGKDVPNAELLKPLDPSQLKECSANEFSQLIQWRNQVDAANAKIDATGANESKWQKSKLAADAAIVAIKTCDSRIAYHRLEPCKKTTKNIINPEPKVKSYDEYVLTKDCAKVEKYLNKFNLRPEKVNVQPQKPQPPISIPNDTPPEVPPIQPVQGIAACTNDEFARLKDWAGQVDMANKSILKMGNNLLGWKYEANAINFSTTATQACEKLLVYHASKPCEKQIDGATKQYTKETISQRCEMARTYFYEFLQRSETLNSKNADLYVDLKSFPQQNFAAQSFTNIGACVIENRTDTAINYSGRKALVVDSRGFSDKMMVLQTVEGLLIQCYGLELDGPFSKNQVERILKTKDTNIKLEYRLK